MEDINELVKQRDKYQRMVVKYENKLSEVEKYIRENCKHTKTKMIDSHIEGGYLNVSEHHKILKCVICDSELDIKITYGTYG